MEIENQSDFNFNKQCVEARFEKERIPKNI